jgi:hypothetical protein
MGKRGGKRPGAGRKFGSRGLPYQLQDNAKAHAIEMIKCHIEDLIDAKLELALGDYYMEKLDQVGQIKVYKAKPSGADISDLLAYAIGKPDQKIEIDGRVDLMLGVANNIRSILGQEEHVIDGHTETST